MIIPIGNLDPYAKNISKKWFWVFKAFEAKKFQLCKLYGFQKIGAAKKAMEKSRFIVPFITGPKNLKI
jgi:hypothetical protein